MHESAALPYYPDGIGKGKRADGHERAVFPETMPGDPRRREPVFALHNSENRDRNSENRRLGIFRELKLVFGA